jgi:predicted transcriptional regulator
MRSVELILGGMLLASGVAPGIPGFGEDLEDTGPQEVEGEAVFAMANYSGPSKIVDQEAALWNEGSLTFDIEADEVAVTEYRWDGARAQASVNPNGTGFDLYGGAGVAREASETFTNVSLSIETDPSGILAVTPNETLGGSEFSLSVPQTSPPPIRASQSGTDLWLKWEGFEHTIPGPVFVLGHRGATFHNVWYENAIFREAQATGGLDVNVMGGTVEIDTGANKETYESGRDTVEGDGDRLYTELTTKRVHTVLSLTNASLATTFEESSEAVFFTKTPSWSVNGSLAFDADEGNLSAGEEDATLANRSVAMEGNTTLELRPHPDERDPVRQPGESLQRPTPPIEASIGGQAESVHVDGQSLALPDQGTVSEDLSFFAQVAGVLLLVWSALKKLTPFIAGLLSKSPLENDRRQRIYEFLEDAGMAHPRLIERSLGIPFSSVLHHLDVLREANLITTVEREGYKVCFPCGDLSEEQSERVAVLASPTRAEIARALVSEGCQTQAEIAEQLGLARSTVSEHMALLTAANLVEADWDQEVIYSPSELLRSWLSAHG